jgi:hypothetical protein
MIREAKDVLQNIVEKLIPEAAVVRSGAEETRAIMARRWPLVSLVTNPGRFDDREAKIFRYVDSEAGVLKQRYVRGSRILPILIRVWAEGEDETDRMFSRIIPAIPKRWELDDFGGMVAINPEEHSDFVDNASKLYLSVAEIQFTVPVALDEEIVPTFKSVESDGPEIAKA